MKPTARTSAPTRPPAVLELHSQYTAGAVMLALLDRAIVTGLASPHWEIDQTGALTGTLTGPDVLRHLDAWRRQLPGASRLCVERRLAEARWTVSVTIREISVCLVGIAPDRSRTAVTV
ncbi:hypothetical protein ACFVYP_06855 [Kitasatospora sp. NPDC058201]|uniref:hypothetical protein n=1 Tax=unclassified Kitasatospora TaxID=2633591 RepID=UPI0036483471